MSGLVDLSLPLPLPLRRTPPPLGWSAWRPLGRVVSMAAIGTLLLQVFALQHTSITSLVQTNIMFHVEQSGWRVKIKPTAIPDTHRK